MKKLPEIDFSEIEHGIDVLEGWLDDLERRRQVGEMLTEEVSELTGTVADEFRRAVAVTMWFGDGIERVRLAFANLAVACAGHATAQVFDRQKRAESAEHGRKGGRPRKEDQAADWMRRYDRMRATSRMLTAQECYEDIANDDLGDPGKWRTVKNRISEYRQQQK